MLGGHQGAHKVHRMVIHDGQILFRVVTLVEDQRDIRSSFCKATTTLQKLLGDAVEGHGVMLIALVGVVEQWHLAIGGNQKGQAEQTKIVSPLLAMAALGQLGAGVEAVEKGEEVGGVEQQTTEI